MNANLIRIGTSMISDFWFKKIGKMIESEDDHGFYEINQRFAPSLLDLGLIEERRWSQNCMGYICTCSAYFVTKKGRKAYKEWKNEL